MPTAEEQMALVSRRKSKQALDAERRLSQPTPQDIEAQQARQRMEQQKEFMFQRSLGIRKIEALEAIAEALHVANEDKIQAWRKRQEDKAVADLAERQRLEAERASQAQATVEVKAEVPPLESPVTGG